MFQIHSLFSILGLHDTLVTNAGCLVGVISLNEVGKSVFIHTVSCCMDMQAVVVVLTVSVGTSIFDELNTY
jgi:hypothetical protein